MINFNEPVYLEKSMEYVKKAILINKRLNGDGESTAKCTEWMEQRFGGSKDTAHDLLHAWTGNGGTAVRHSAGGRGNYAFIHVRIYRKRICAPWGEDKVCRY